jgi:hypothetical protein
MSETRNTDRYNSEDNAGAHAPGNNKIALYHKATCSVKSIMGIFEGV